MKSNYDNYFINRVGLEDVQKKLETNEMIFQYLTLEDSLLVLSILKDSVGIKLIKASDKVASFMLLFNQYKPTLNQKNKVEAYQKKASLLFQELLGNIPNNIEHIIILPDKDIFQIPFSALVKEIKDKNTFKALDYLVNHYSFSYDYSLSHHFNIKTDSRTIKNGYGVFAIDQGLNTKQEIQQIKKTISNFRVSKSKAELIQQLPEIDLLHFGSHGIADTSKINSNYLSINHNEKLLEHELSNLILQSKLVFINACESAKGKYLRGEGVFSISRTMLQSGCKSIIASLWKIPDLSAAKLSNIFYTNIKNSPYINPAKNLQNTQLEYLNTIDQYYSHPYYWAALSSIGSNNRIYFDKKSKHTLIWMLPLFFLIGIMVANKFKE